MSAPRTKLLPVAGMQKAIVQSEGPKNMHVAIEPSTGMQTAIHILTRICLPVEYTVGFSKNSVQNESIELYSLDKLLIISIQCILFKFST